MIGDAALTDEMATNGICLLIVEALEDETLTLEEHDVWAELGLQILATDVVADAEAIVAAH